MNFREDLKESNFLIVLLFQWQTEKPLLAEQTVSVYISKWCGWLYESMTFPKEDMASNKCSFPFEFSYVIQGWWHFMLLHFMPIQQLASTSYSNRLECPPRVPNISVTWPRFISEISCLFLVIAFTINFAIVSRGNIALYGSLSAPLPRVRFAHK